jgi:hypothetical protein
VKLVDSAEEVLKLCGEKTTVGMKVDQTESGCVVGIRKADGQKVCLFFVGNRVYVHEDGFLNNERYILALAPCDTDVVSARLHACLPALSFRLRRASCCDRICWTRAVAFFWLRIHSCSLVETANKYICSLHGSANAAGITTPTLAPTTAWSASAPAVPQLPRTTTKRTPSLEKISVLSRLRMCVFVNESTFFLLCFCLGDCDLPRYRYWTTQAWKRRYFFSK